MKKSAPKTYAAWILFSEAVGALSGYLTREGTELYNTTIIQPPLSPPSIVFPIVWSILFALMGIGAARIYLSPPSPARTRSLLLFLLQLAFNFFWSIIFFNFQAFGFALIWLAALWVLILLMILSFRQVDPLAAWLQLPYLLWVTFAAYLNFAVWLLNE
jgi:tryptophan-rich sensory protein